MEPAASAPRAWTASKDRAAAKLCRGDDPRSIILSPDTRPCTEVRLGVRAQTRWDHPIVDKKEVILLA